MSTRWSSHAYSADAIRAAEERSFHFITPDELMDMAAQAVVAEVGAQIRASDRRSIAGAHVVVLVGAGKNGGDGLLAGAHLLDASAHVDAVLCSPTAFEPALADFTAAGGQVSVLADDVAVASQLVSRADAVVDAIAGLGGRPGLSGPVEELVAQIAPSARIVAVDVPSGVEADTGLTPGSHVRAHATVTFGAPKPCHLLAPAALACGQVTVATLGIPVDPADARPDLSSPTRTDVAALLTKPQAPDHKYTRPVVGVIAGDHQFPGAGVLTVAGAWRCGAGMVRYVGPRRSADLVLHHRPETVVHDLDVSAGLPRVDAWVLGPGVAADSDSLAALRAAWDLPLPAVVDAALVSELARRPRSGPTVATPHAGELAQALSVVSAEVTRAQVEADPLSHALALAAHTGATVLLKGAVTTVAEPDGTAATIAHAPPWLATAGAGDVLAGIIGCLLASGLSAHESAVAAAWLHGEAAHRATVSGGRTAPGPIVAVDVADALPGAIGDLLKP